MGHTRSHASPMKQQNAEIVLSCPARNKKCTSCGKLNHFAKVCRTVPPDSVKRVMEEEGTDDDDYVYAVEEKKQPMCRLEIDREYLEMMLDSGASVNLIDKVTYERIYKGKAKTLEQAKRRIFSYGSPTPLPLLGTIQAKITAKSNSTLATLHVSGNLLGYETAQRLGLLKIVNQVGTDKTSPQYLASGEFENLFGGIGKVKGKVVKLHIDPDVQPKQQSHRRIPFHVRRDVEKELERLENLDIIEKVTDPTPWVSPIVVVPKSSGQVRLCVDMREANKAVKPYNCHLVYRPGKDTENPTDFMSRHPNLQATAERNVADEYVNYVCTNAIPKAMTLQEIQSETEKDPTLQSLIKAIETDHWTDSEILDYKRLKDELLVYSGVVLRGNRIVVPSKLRERAVDLAHVGHQGIVKTKSLIREKVWFPGIDKMVKDKVDNYLACQAVTPSKSSRIEPLQMTPLPSGPWKMLAMDFLGPFPSGDS